RRESSECPVHARLVPPGSDDGNRLSLPPSASARNGCPGRCTARRTLLCVRSLPSALPSLSPSILPPPTAPNKSRWWHRPKSRSGQVKRHLVCKPWTIEKADENSNGIP